MKIAAALSLLASASAFAPLKSAKSSTSLNALNGWTADSSKMAYGLPGAIPPFADGFDPLNLSADKDLDTMKVRGNVVCI
jgi:hypothetical protein